MEKTTNSQKIILILFGFFLSLLTLEAILQLGSVIFLSLQNTENVLSDTLVGDKENVYRILSLGESTTMDLLNGQSSWPRQLERTLNNKSEKIKFKVFNKGIGASNTAIILDDLDENLRKYQPHMVVTMMGINEEVYGFNRG